MTNTQAIRHQIASLTAGQDDATLLDSWITACRSRLDAETADEARPFTIAMDAIEAELTSRGMTPDEFSALFIATCAA